MGYPKTMVAVSWLTCASQDVRARMALHVLSVGMAQVRAPWLDSREDVIFTCINLGMQVEGKADVFTGFLWWLTLFTLGGVQSQLSLAAGTDLILYLPRTWHPMFDPDLRVELVGDAWQCSHLLHPEDILESWGVEVVVAEEQWPQARKDYIVKLEYLSPHGEEGWWHTTGISSSSPPSPLA